MRLTRYDEHKKRWQINNDYGAVMIDELNYAVGEAIDKLAAYEDMELTPEEFHESVAFVLELNKKLKPYMDAEEQGLLVRLPCKAGDKVYRIHTHDHIEEWHVMAINVSASGVWYWDESGRETPVETIGKTVFLTREEAEAALKGEREDV